MAMNPLQLQEMAEFEERREEMAGFRVHDISSADWCMRKLAANQAKRKEYESYVQSEIERLQTWLKNECESLDRDAEFFTAHLTAWHKQLLENDPKHNKSVKLPHGVLKSRTVKSEPSKLDEKAILEHLKSNGEEAFVKVVETVDWGEYKKTLSLVDIDGQPAVVDGNGEIVPGVAIKVGGTKFSVEVAE
ncbi:host-nuclease inhibitor Gam family protein [Alicyclobacillus fastidiosus]|uniref:Host-nuclease inhibitor Gam family protein n=1 Tax=Alicyclobacillus fastidiosus TaxID=392011 RepID=A0ABY6ZJ51_9BACL|nr:host-nuclease inhibitor Gam family protein [Alicyclobacillus fastidiosus]WAH42805.1 host-nuclease inhibitor Gam family protein [Alicyclobacillus fastidiosus]GMA64727.1 hypothetical protein GCM10025859_51670 [Alicyclobacillus fastidiosus]